jgi:hypothetical protein
VKPCTLSQNFPVGNFELILTTILKVIMPHFLPFVVYFTWSYIYESGPGSVVGITTGYGLDGSGIKSRCGEIFRTCLDRPWGPYSLLNNGYRVFSGVKSGQGVTLTTHLLLVPWLWMSRAIPLLPLWAVRPVQNLSSCTRVHFTFTFIYIYTSHEIDTKRQ